MTIEPNVVFGPGVGVEEGATIRAFSHLEGALVRPGAIVGPFARIRPESVAAAGYGEFDPVSENETPEGRQKNRRLEIILMPKLQDVSA